MRFDLTRPRQWGSALAWACLALAWAPAVQAQHPSPPPPAPNPVVGLTTPVEPAAADPTPADEPTAEDPAPPAEPARQELTVEERLRKLEEMNEKLLKQNAELAQQVKTLNQKVAKAAEKQPEEKEPEEKEPEEKKPEEKPAEPPQPPDYPLGGTGLAKDKEISPAASSQFGTRLSPNWLWFQSADGKFKAHVGGRVQFDNSIFHANNQVQFGPRGIGRLRDGTDFRRARLRVEGSMYEQMTFATEFDFVNGVATAGRPTSGGLPAAGDVFAVPAPTDLWVNFGNIPLIGNFRVGNQKDPYGFEHLVSSRFLPFMERSFNQDAFYGPFNNGFIPGFQVFNSAFDDRMTWATGVFKNTNNVFAYDVNAGDIAVPLRLTWLPIYEEDGRRLLHLGITGRQSGVVGHIARYRVRGPERAGLPPLWPQYANTENFIASGGRQDINLEAVSVLGPFEIQAEYNFNFTQDAFRPGQPGVGTLYYSGGYVEVLYFLTGEHREYNRKTAIFDRVVPNENAYLVKNEKGHGHKFGTGAWQVGIRYNYLNLNDKGINGGVLNDMTIGLNWFINPNIKVQWNYSYTDRHSPGALSDGVIQGAGMRFAWDF